MASGAGKSLQVSGGMKLLAYTREFNLTVSEVALVNFDHTMRYEPRLENEAARKAFELAYRALTEKGYNPVYQIAGYLISGDPAYITNHLEARNTIRRIERDELIEELVRSYAERHGQNSRD